jgi:hypothetical protein
VVHRFVFVVVVVVVVGYGDGRLVWNSKFICRLFVLQIYAGRLVKERSRAIL